MADEDRVLRRAPEGAHGLQLLPVPELVSEVSLALGALEPHLCELPALGQAVLLCRTSSLGAAGFVHGLGGVQRRALSRAQAKAWTAALAGVCSDAETAFGFLVRRLRPRSRRCRLRPAAAETTAAKPHEAAEPKAQRCARQHDHGGGEEADGEVEGEPELLVVVLEGSFRGVDAEYDEREAEETWHHHGIQFGAHDLREVPRRRVCTGGFGCALSPVALAATAKCLCARRSRRRPRRPGLRRASTSKTSKSGGRAARPTRCEAGALHGDVRVESRPTRAPGDERAGAASAAGRAAAAARGADAAVDGAGELRQAAAGRGDGGGGADRQGGAAEHVAAGGRRGGRSRVRRRRTRGSGPSSTSTSRRATRSRARRIRRTRRPGGRRRRRRRARRRSARTPTPLSTAQTSYGMAASGGGEARRGSVAVGPPDDLALRRSPADHLRIARRLRAATAAECGGGRRRRAAARPTRCRRRCRSRRTATRGVVPEHPATNGPARGRLRTGRAEAAAARGADAAVDGAGELRQAAAGRGDGGGGADRQGGAAEHVAAGGLPKGEVDPAYDDAAPRQWTVEHIDEPTGNSESRAAYPAHPATRGRANAAADAPPPQGADPTPLSTAQASYGRLPLAEAKRGPADPSPWKYRRSRSTRKPADHFLNHAPRYAPPRGRAATELAVEKAAAGGTAVALGLLVATPTRSEVSSARSPRRRGAARHRGRRDHRRGGWAGAARPPRRRQGRAGRPRAPPPRQPRARRRALRRRQAAGPRLLRAARRRHPRPRRRRGPAQRRPRHLLDVGRRAARRPPPRRGDDHGRGGAS